MAEEIGYSVKGISERQIQSSDQHLEPAAIRVTFRHYNVCGLYVPSHGPRLILPETCRLVNHVSIWVPAGESPIIRKVAKTLQCQTMTAMGIPETVHSEIVEKIASEASFKHATGYSAWIVVEMRIPSWFKHDYDVYLMLLDIEEALRTNEDEFRGRQTNPATKSSVDALERFVFLENLTPPTSCTVCMEEIEVGPEIIRLPCSHFLSSGLHPHVAAGQPLLSTLPP
ncbi:conserved hypothetical protein [Ricinus communis]|uniref:RING-type domain-containing protein n=1 Tax=Ricinus communis TaxID=3988 RepID=B9SJE6_RICCO|nr:conserved hypothetical protein [Ricinus communis]|eukprot:XP_002526115.1 uncharacterized protein LOC8285069 [Ricinus communis]